MGIVAEDAGRRGTLPGLEEYWSGKVLECRLWRGNLRKITEVGQATAGQRRHRGRRASKVEGRA